MKKCDLRGRFTPYCPLSNLKLNSLLPALNKGGGGHSETGRSSLLLLLIGGREVPLEQQKPQMLAAYGSIALAAISKKSIVLYDGKKRVKNKKVMGCIRSLSVLLCR